MLTSKYLRSSDAKAAIARHNAKGGVQYRLGMVRQDGKWWYRAEVNVNAY